MKFSSFLRSIINGSFLTSRRKAKNAKKLATYGRICPYCKGSGLNNDSPLTPLSMQPQHCNVCGGTGRIPN